MADQIKPRYRLGTQYHLDLAKDDATKIPERTLFKVRALIEGDNSDDALHIGDAVVRGLPDKIHAAPLDDTDSVCVTTLSGCWNYVNSEHLQPLI